MTWMADKGMEKSVTLEEALKRIENLEIAKRNNVSERTIYRYKAYYDKMRKVEKN